MAHLSIRVLGPLEVRLDGEPVSGFATDKVRALLAYLALSPDRPHRREALAGLLWPEFPERSARTNLRNALANLRKVICDGATSPAFLDGTRQTIQFNGQSDYWLDADIFESLVVTSPPTSEALKQAVSLVRGPFLEGFTLGDAAPFEEWLLLTREYYGRRWAEALGSLAAIYEGQGDYESALAHARRGVELEPWQEGGQRQLMRLLARSGHRSQALAQYEKLCRALQDELGAEPSVETRALWEDILSGDLAPEPALRGSPLPVWYLPASPTPFFGRVDELSALEAKLTEPLTRLVTITGVGGSGKTRVALEVSSRLAERERQALAGRLPLTFAHGIVFVPLADLDAIEGLVAALADALRLRLEGGQVQLLEFMRPRQLLLVLDNLEQLMAGVGFLSEILCSAPGVKILATSRERLQLQGEHVLTLGGLPYPKAGLEPSTQGVADDDASLAASPALQLLTEGVRRLRPDYAPNAADLRVMLDICSLVDGLPLALELAASWGDTLSLDDILLEARRGLGFWQVEWRDVPERQHSMRAVFDASCRRLLPEQRAAFYSLSVFRGGFTLEAAGQVVAGAEAIPSLLATLVRKSLLQYDQARDRYGIHELLRQYGAEKLDSWPDARRAAQDRHCAHFSAALQRWEADMLGSQQQAALSEMEVESENIRAAWYWAVDQALVERLDGAMEGLEHFYWQSGRYQEAEAALQAAANAVAAAGKTAQTSAERAACLRACVRALAWQSNFLRAQGRRDAARRLQQQCLTILKDPALAGWDTRLERAILAFSMGLTICMADYEQGRQRFEETYSLYRELESRWGMALALNAWGTMSMFLGAHQDAKRRLGEALSLSRALGNASGIANSLDGLVQIARAEGRFAEAELMAREGISTSLEAGTRTQAAMSHLTLGVTLEKVAKLSEAHSVLQQALALFNDLGHVNYITSTHNWLGSTNMHLGRYQESREYAQIALARAREHGPPISAGLSLLLLGCLDLAEGHHAGAHQHLQDSIAVYQNLGHRDDLSWGSAVLAVAALELEDVREARHHLRHAFQLAIESGAVPPLLWALPAMARLLADQGEVERAVELYALASRHPFVAKSRWFTDVVGRRITAAADTLPADQVAILQECGRTRDLDAIIAELLSELRT